MLLPHASLAPLRPRRLLFLRFLSFCASWRRGSERPGTRSRACERKWPQVASGEVWVGYRGKNVFTERVVGCWGRLRGEVGESPALEGSKHRVDTALWDVVQQAWWCGLMVGLDDLGGLFQP